MKKYDQHHNIAYNYTPAKVIYAEVVADISDYLKKRDGNQFSIRSGGHHHEAMCTLDQGHVLDLSRLKLKVEVLTSDACKPFLLENRQETCQAKFAAWLPSNLTNEEVLNLPELSENGILKKIIPIGSCSQVSLGGYILGGGWNLLGRKYGWACDSLLAVELVLADGRIEIVSEQHLPDLFKALKGSGGGNFGIVTRFLMKLYDTDQIWSFMGAYKKGMDFTANLENWILKQHTTDNTITSYLTIQDSLGVNFGGYFIFFEKDKSIKEELLTYFGNQSEIYEKTIQAIAHKHEPHIPTLQALTNGNQLFTNELKTMDFRLPFEISALLGSRASAKASYKCKEPVAHKVTSAFLKEEFSQCPRPFISCIETFIKANKVKGAFNIITLHAIGGETKNGNNVLAYTNKTILVQIQSWWLEKEDAPICRAWVSNFRSALEPFIKGAFINFQDSDIQLNEYYGTDYPSLQQIKREYDPHQVFNFPMAIPLNNKSESTK